MTDFSRLAEQISSDRGPCFYSVHRTESRFLDQKFKLLRLVDGPRKGAGVRSQGDLQSFFISAMEALVFYFKQLFHEWGCTLFKMVFEHEQGRAPVDSL